MKTRKVSSLTFVEEAIEVLQAKQRKSNQCCLLIFLLTELKALLLAFASQRKVFLALGENEGHAVIKATTRVGQGQK